MLSVLFKNILSSMFGPCPNQTEYVSHSLSCVCPMCGFHGLPLLLLFLGFNGGWQTNLKGAFLPPTEMECEAHWKGSL